MRIILLLLLVAVSQASTASTFANTCIPIGCTGPTTLPPEPPDYSGTLSEIALGGDGILELKIARSLYLDRSIYDANLEQFTSFTSDAGILFDPLPPEFELPTYTDFNYFGEVIVSPEARIEFLSDVLIRGLNFNGDINIHAVGNIIVVDTATIFPTPIPPTLFMLLSGLALTVRRIPKAMKSNKALKSDPLQRALQLWLRIFTPAKRAVTGGLARR